MPSPTSAQSAGPRRPIRAGAGLLLRCVAVWALAWTPWVSAHAAESASPPASEPLSVFVTVLPLVDAVQRIGGDGVRVTPLVRPGQNPHTYEPTPRQVAALAKADLYVRLGLPLEDAWLPRIRGTNPRIRILDARDGLPLRANDPVHEPDGADRHDHDHGAQDTHLWTSPPLVKSIGAAVRDALIALRPADAATFTANYNRYAAELDALDAELRARLAPFKGRAFMVFHPAWGYFADTYGLVQVAVEVQGKEPGARALAGLIEQARADGIRTILVQPQMSPRAAGQIAAAIGGRVASIDPLSPDLFATLRQLADLIAAGDAP